MIMNEPKYYDGASSLCRYPMGMGKGFERNSPTKRGGRGALKIQDAAGLFSEPNKWKRSSEQ